MFTRTRWLRRRRMIVGLALGFATFVAAGSASGAPILEPRLEWLQSQQQQQVLEPRLEWLQSQQQLYDHTRYGASHQVRPYAPGSPPSVNSGIMSKSLIEQHMVNEERAVKLAGGVPNYSHLPAEDRAAIFAPAAGNHETATATSSGSGFDRGDWMRGFALAALLVSASAFATIMVRGGVRTAHS
jgi:hypothetical protein